MVQEVKTSILLSFLCQLLLVFSFISDVTSLIHSLILSLTWWIECYVRLEYGVI